MSNHDHSEMVARKLAAPVPPPADERAENRGDVQSSVRPEPPERASEVRLKHGKPLCVATKKDGTLCGSYALGPEHGDIAAYCMGHARSELGHTPEPKTEAVQGSPEPAAAPVKRKRTPVDVLREKVEANPDKYVALWEKAAAEGRDVRALSAIFTMLREDSETHVEVPHTFDELAKLDREERRALMRQLERDGLEPFNYDEYRKRNKRTEP